MMNNQDISLYIDELKQKVTTTEPPIHVVTCSEAEVQRLEEQLGIRLPDGYKKFLLWMGKDGGPIMRGSSCFYKDVIPIQEWAVELLHEDHFPYQLPDDAFVIWMHQGYQFAFVRLTEGENPPLYYYHEMHEQQDFVNSYEYFTDFLRDHVENSLEFWRQNPNWYLK